jgi:large subunit ribosomal protein L17
MRHRVAYRKLGRVTAHRIAMLRNQATALLRYEHLTTTVPRAKELRPFVERIITIAKRGVAEVPGGKSGPDGKALHARRLVMHDLQDREVVTKLFDTLAPRFALRPGGYTRLLRLGFRKGDSAEVAQVELVGSEFDPRATAETQAKGEGEKAKPKAKGVGGRLRAAAERLRGGKKKAEAGESESAAAAEAKAAKRAAKKGTAGRKVGGSSKGK